MLKKIIKSMLSFFNKISNNKLGSTILYIVRTHQIPHYKNPRNFNDKTMNLKFSYKNNDLVVKCTDKYEVREYIKEKGCEEILNELYGVYKGVNEINFMELPNKFALKCTHGCAYNSICSNKNELDIEKTKNKLNNWLKEKYGWATGELHYTKIEPRIICEKYLCDENGKMPIDYKIYCLNGKAVGILTCTEREEGLKRNFYDLNWNELLYIKDKYRNKKKIEKPKNLEEMIKYAEILSKDFKFVRVDLYNDNGKIIFGELTFTPACCCNKIYNQIGNRELGKKLEI